MMIDCEAFKARVTLRLRVLPAWREGAGGVIVSTRGARRGSLKRTIAF